MKKNLVFFFLGAFIFSSITALASSKVNLIEVLYNVNDIVINGESKMPTEKPFTYKDTTYVPLRYMAEEFGYDVDWDATSNSVIINTPTAEVSKQQVKKVADSKYNFIVGKSQLDFSAIHYSYEEKYALAYESTFGNYIRRAIDGNCTTFKATLKSCLDEGKALSGDMILNIYLDSTLQYTLYFEGGTQLKDTPLELNISGAKEIQFEMVTVADDDQKKGIEIGLYDCQFIK